MSDTVTPAVIPASAWTRMWNAGIEAGEERIITGLPAEDLSAVNLAELFGWAVVQEHWFSFQSVLATSPNEGLVVLGNTPWGPCYVVIADDCGDGTFRPRREPWPKHAHRPRQRAYWTRCRNAAD